MRIDLNPAVTTELDRNSRATVEAKRDDMVRKVPPNAVPKPNPLDVTHLSSGSEAIGKLKAQVDAAPEVRQQKVDALRQAMTAGTYQISPQRIAGAMLAEAERKLG